MVLSLADCTLVLLDWLIWLFVMGVLLACARCRPRLAKSFWLGDLDGVSACLLRSFMLGDLDGPSWRPLSSDAMSKTGSSVCSCSTHISHSIHPSTVPTLPALTIVTGDTFSCMIPEKQQTKTIIVQTCCTITVDSPTSGQKSYGCRRGLRWRASKNVSSSV